jgi:hypothetical protein
VVSASKDTRRLDAMGILGIIRCAKGFVDVRDRGGVARVSDDIDTGRRPTSASIVSVVCWRVECWRAGGVAENVGILLSSADAVAEFCISLFAGTALFPVRGYCCTHDARSKRKAEVSRDGRIEVEKLDGLRTNIRCPFRHRVP